MKAEALRMYLQDFVETNIKYDTSKISSDKELSSEIQEILINQGLLSPTVKNIFDKALI